VHFVGGAGTSTIDHARIEHTPGMLVTDGARLEIRNTQFVNNEKGLEISGGSTVMIENTHFASTTDGTVLDARGSVLSVASSTITNTLDGHAIDAWDGVYLTVASTTIDGVDGVGVYISESPTTITNSIIGNTGDDGVSAANSDVSIMRSTVHHTGGIAVDVAGAENFVLRDTEIRAPADVGISLIYSTSTVTNVTVDGEATSTWDGIWINGGATIIASSTISGFTAGAGVFVDNIANVEHGEHATVLIANTEVSGNNVGIEVETGAAVVLEDVFLHDNETDVIGAVEVK
jgi:hypothetical protein